MVRGHKQNDDLLMEDELAAAFLSDDESAIMPEDNGSVSQDTQSDDNWDENDEGDMPGQLAVDVYETDERLIVKARTAGVNKSDLDVSISDGILTINTLSIRGTLSAGNEDDVENYFVQECYWGEFSRTLALPVQVKEDEVEAVLKDGVLTIGFTKIKQEQARKIEIM